MDIATETAPLNSVGDRDLAKLLGDVGVAKLCAPTCAEFTYAVNLNAHKPHNLILRTIYFLYGILYSIFAYNYYLLLVVLYIASLYKHPFVMGVRTSYD